LVFCVKKAENSRLQFRAMSLARQNFFNKKQRSDDLSMQAYLPAVGALKESMFQGQFFAILQ
jgi:hypothetical protein